MSDELSTYEKRRLELEEKKVELLSSIRKDLRRHQRFSNVHKLVDELDIDKHDIGRLAQYVEHRVDGREEETSSKGGTTKAIGELVAALTSKNVDVSVDVENEDDSDG